jgi:hypothetical protein
MVRNRYCLVLTDGETYIATHEFRTMKRGAIIIEQDD